MKSLIKSKKSTLAEKQKANDFYILLTFCCRVYLFRFGRKCNEHKISLKVNEEDTQRERDSFSN